MSCARAGMQLMAILAAFACCGLCSLVPVVRAQSQVQSAPMRVNSSQHFANVSPSSAILITSQQSLAGVAGVTTQKPNYLETGRQITGILDRFMNAGYDKRVRPNYGGPPVEVNVTMRILSISSVSEVMMDFTADFYFRQTWHDPRLAFRKLGDIQTLYVGAEVSKKIWLPDTFFGNEKMAYFHEATTPNVFLRIDHSGEVYRSIRLTVTSSCPMNLQYFPMDRQRCTIEAESYGYNVKDIIYRWARSTAVERDKEISLPQFDIVQTVQKYRLEELSSGTYSRLIAEIHFARRMGYYLIQIYIPSSLIVVISWVSFWLHRNASPARVQLGVTTVLTMTTLMSSTNAALPKISYVKSIDIFLGTCFVMVFAALLEYATVGYLGKRIAMRKAHAQHAQSQAQAKLFAQLQAQGAQGDSVALTESAGSTGTPTAVASGHLGLFGHSPLTDTQQTPSAMARAQQQLMSVRATPLSALLDDPQLLSAVAAATAAASGNSASPATSDNQQHLLLAHRHNHQQARNQDHVPCQQVVAEERPCACDLHLEPLVGLHKQRNSHRHHCHHAHNRTAANCSHHRNAPPPPPPPPPPSAIHCGHLHQSAAPEAPPRRNLPAQKQYCQCGDKAATSHTLPRNATFAHSCTRQPAPDECHPPRSGHQPLVGCCTHHNHQRQHLHQQPPSYALGDSLPPSAQINPISPSKGVASAAAAAAATFVNLHRKTKGLPPSTNPNFAPFAASYTGPHDRHLETIFGIRPSDIDKYSRVVFPVCFVCFQLMYWIVYLHISAFLEPDQQSQSLQPPVLPAPPPPL